MIDDVSAFRLIPHSHLKATLQNVELCFAHRTLETQQQPVVVVTRIIEPIGIGQQRPVDGTYFQQSMPVLAGPCQTTHLQTNDQPDSIRADFREQSLEAAASFRRTAAASLVFINNLDRNARPSARQPRDRNGPDSEPGPGRPTK